MENKRKFRVVGVGRVMIAGSFVTVGSGNPTVVKGKGFTVARAAAGRYTVTLDQSPVAIDSIVTGWAPETVGEFGITYVDQDSITASVFEIRVATTADCSSTNFALDDDAGSVVSFQAVVRDSTIDA